LTQIEANGSTRYALQYNIKCSGQKLSQATFEHGKKHPEMEKF
jgi:hypothetical protein